MPLLLGLLVVAGLAVWAAERAAQSSAPDLGAAPPPGGAAPGAARAPTPKAPGPSSTAPAPINLSNLMGLGWTDVAPTDLDDAEEPWNAMDQANVEDGGDGMDSIGGLHFQQALMRQLWIPASQVPNLGPVEMPQFIWHDALYFLTKLAKSYDVPPSRAQAFNLQQQQNLSTDTGSTDLGLSVASAIPIAGQIAALIKFAFDQSVNAFKANTATWQQQWAAGSLPAGLRQYLVPCDGGAEDPLPPNLVPGVGDAVDGLYKVLPPASYVQQPFSQVKGWNVKHNSVVGPVYWRARLFTRGPISGWVLPWGQLGSDQGSLRARINYCARIYRAIDTLSCLANPPQSRGWKAYDKGGAQYIWDDPYFGPIWGSIFPHTKDQPHVEGVDFYGGAYVAPTVKAVSAGAITAIISAPSSYGVDAVTVQQEPETDAASMATPDVTVTNADPLAFTVEQDTYPEPAPEPAPAPAPLNTASAPVAPAQILPPTTSAPAPATTTSAPVTATQILAVSSTPTTQPTTTTIAVSPARLSSLVKIGGL